MTINTRVELGCEVSGFPKPSFQWFLNDVPLMSDSAILNPLVIPNFRFFFWFILECIHVYSFHLKFMVKKMDYRNSDAGFYKCEITQQCRDGSFQTISTGSSKMSLENCAPLAAMADGGVRTKAPCLARLIATEWYDGDEPGGRAPASARGRNPAAERGEGHIVHLLGEIAQPTCDPRRSTLMGGTLPPTAPPARMSLSQETELVLLIPREEDRDCVATGSVDDPKFAVHCGPVSEGNGQ